jgi:hypothetical protein
MSNSAQGVAPKIQRQARLEPKTALVIQSCTALSSSWEALMATVHSPALSEPLMRCGRKQPYSHIRALYCRVLVCTSCWEQKEVAPPPHLLVWEVGQRLAPSLERGRRLLEMLCHWGPTAGANPPAQTARLLVQGCASMTNGPVRGFPREIQCPIQPKASPQKSRDRPDSSPRLRL